MNFCKTENTLVRTFLKWMLLQLREYIFIAAISFPANVFGTARGETLVTVIPGVLPLLYGLRIRGSVVK